MMIELLHRTRCWIAFALIALLAACNVKADMDMERTVRDIENKFSRGEDISQDTSIFQARRFFNLSDDAEMKTLAALYSGCVYWEQSNYDSAMAALNEAIVLAKDSGDEALMEKVQQTIAELHSDLNRSEEMMEGYLKRKKLLIFCSIALLIAAIVVGWLLVRANQKRKQMAAMNLSIEELQKECESLTETHRDNLFQRAMTIYKVFLIGEKKDTDAVTFQKLKSSVCGSNVSTAYEAIHEAYSKVYSEVVQRIKEHQPALTEAEYRVCILSMMPFSVKEVADILKVSPAMIGKARTSIRKKMGMTDAMGKTFSEQLLHS